MQTAHVNINKEERGNRMYIIQFIRGFCMALADSVPGVSGGTVAFLLGFYDQFIDSIDDLITGNMEKKKTAFFFLIKLGIGWVTGMILAILILANVFESHIYAISSLFIGFIIFAIPIVVREELDTLKGIYVFIAGAVAICAMVLPGISGSTLLLIMGLYLPIVTAIKDILHLNLKSFPTVFVFGCGVLVGIFSIVKLIRKALERFRAQMIFLIVGLMLGSIYAVIMGPTTLDTPQPAMTIHNFSILFFIIGGVVIFGLQQMKKIKK